MIDWDLFSNPRRRWLTPEQRDELDDLLHHIIVEVYDNYRQYGNREPVLTTSLLVDDVTFNHGFADFNALSPKRRRSLVDAALRRLQRRGLITSSLCSGERRAEVHCWEPLNVTSS